MPIARPALFAFALLALSAASVPAHASSGQDREVATDDDGYEVTTRRTYDGYRTSDSDGTSRTTRRTYDGGIKTTYDDGYSVTTRRTYNNGWKTSDNQGRSITTRQTYDGYRTTYDEAPNGRCRPTNKGGRKCR